MRRSQKSKRVTWLSDVKLCQVKLFISEESPSKVGTGTQVHLQGKALWPVQSGCIWPDDSLPPGFEVIQPANLRRVKLSKIPLTKWRCPLRIEVKKEWQVVAGEESNELEAENQREMRVLEAIYPRPFAIPPNPSASPGVEDSYTNDQNTPIVSTTPIEEDEAAMVLSSGCLSADSTRAVEPDILAAAQAAIASLINSDQGGLIDRNLLQKILCHAKMVEQLKSYGVSSSLQTGPSSTSSWQNMPSSSFQSTPVIGVQTVTSSIVHHMPANGAQNVTQNTPSTRTQHMPNLWLPPNSRQNMPSSSFQSTAVVGTQTITSSSLSNIPASGVQNVTQNMSSTRTRYTPKNLFNPINKRDPLSAHVTRPEHIAPSTASPTVSSYPPQIQAGPGPSLRPSLPNATSTPSSSFGAPMTKDINYYKNLIQQHGGERRDPLPQFAHRNNQLFGTTQEPVNFMKSRDQKTKIMKPCVYFNSFKGCRNGCNCVYLHDTSFQLRISSIPEVQSSKRMKLDSVITG